MLLNLILTVALITQVREVQQRVAGLPTDVASKRDVAALRPLQVRQILTQNCVGCHTARRLATTISMEPAELQRTIERMAMKQCGAWRGWNGARSSAALNTS